jgi:O-antigen/teichoic acid export membrane protein
MLRILEVSWLVVFLCGLAFAAVKAFTEGPASAVYILLFTAVALALYLIRRRQRILMEREKRSGPG